MIARSVQIAILLAIFINPGAAQAATISGKVKVATAPTNGGVVVYIDKIPGKVFTPDSKPVTLDQLNLKFVPHVMAVLLGTTVIFPNSDVVRHNVFSPGPVMKFNLGTYPVGKSRQLVFNKPGVVPLLCNIHAEMSAYVVVTETPYSAISDADGNYAIPNVPPGKYVLKAWQEKPKFGRQEITVAAADLKGINFDLK